MGKKYSQLLLYHMTLIFILGIFIQLACAPLAANVLDLKAAPYIQNLIFWIQCQKDPTLRPALGILSLIEKQPYWPGLKDLQQRAEEALSEDMIRAEPKRYIRFFKRFSPKTTQGWMCYLLALKHGGNKADLSQVARLTWEKRVFKKEDDATFLKCYSPYLTPDVTHKRLCNMIFGKEAEGLKQTIPLLRHPTSKQVASFALDCLTLKNTVLKTYNALPKRLQHNELVIFALLHYLQKKKSYSHYLRVFASLPPQLKYAEYFYLPRLLAGRESLEEGKFAQAYRIFSRHGLTPKHLLAYTEMLWHQGWVALSFIGKPKQALSCFDEFVRIVKSPISLARGYYWLGRAHEALGNKKHAHKAFHKAMKHRRAFYGQMAAQRLGKPLVTPLKDINDYLPQKRGDFYNQEMIRVVRILASLGAEAQPWLWQFLNAYQPRNRHEKFLLLKLAHDVHSFAVVTLARSFWLKDSSFPLLKIAYPLCRTPGSTLLEKALIHTICYKESRFDPLVRGDAGEYGLMQVMPHVGVLEAKTLCIPHYEEKLFDPWHNMRIGLAHVHRHHQSYTGNCALTLAGYNAGTNAVKKWLTLNGKPLEPRHGKGLVTPQDKAIHWLESISYTTVRGYVQRSLETLAIYRTLLGESAKQTAELAPLF